MVSSPRDFGGDFELRLSLGGEPLAPSAQQQHLQMTTMTGDVFDVVLTILSHRNGSVFALPIALAEKAAWRLETCILIIRVWGLHSSARWGPRRP